MRPVLPRWVPVMLIGALLGGSGALPMIGAADDEDSTAVPPMSITISPQQGQDDADITAVPSPEPAPPPSKTTKTASQPAKTTEAKLEERLNDILDHQQQILKRLDDVMEELRIVKIRATVR